MKLVLSSFVFAFILCGLSVGQSVVISSVVNTGTLQTGFAVITPTTGTGEGLSVSEIFGELIDGNLFQSAVIASPLVTLTDVVINADPATGLNTGIAIANPEVSTATVTLSLRDQQGGTVAERTITIGSHQQLSRFVTELFLGDPAFARPVTGLLFISSDLPVGVVALSINGTSFTALPVAAQLGSNSVINTPAASTTTSTFNGVTITSVTPPFSIPATPTFNGVTMPPTILPIPVTVIPFTSTVPVVASTGQITGGLFGIPQTTSTVSAGTQSITSLPTTVFPQLSFGVGGPGALLLPQVATGGGWVSQITIANTAVFTQTVRVDFFSPAGAALSVPSGSTASNIVIAPGGVVTLRL
jgi:hypothetical protein